MFSIAYKRSLHSFFKKNFILQEQCDLNFAFNTKVYRFKQKKNQNKFRLKQIYLVLIKKECNLTLSQTLGFAKYLYTTLVSNKHLAMLLLNQLDGLWDELELNKSYFSLKKAQNYLLCNNKNNFE